MIPQMYSTMSDASFGLKLLCFYLERKCAVAASFLVRISNDVVRTGVGQAMNPIRSGMVRSDSVISYSYKAVVSSRECSSNVPEA